MFQVRLDHAERAEYTISCLHFADLGIRRRYVFWAKQKVWCRRRESNPRPRDYETLALPLSYAGTKTVLNATKQVANVSSIPSDRYFPDLRAFAGSGQGNKARSFPLRPQARHGKAAADFTSLLCIVEDSDLFGS
jgi:hypothetical protein